MEKCVLCGREFTSRSDFDRHACKEIVRPTRRPPALWAIEGMWLTQGLAIAFFLAHRADWGGPLVVGAIFVIYTVFTALSFWGLLKIQSEDVPQWLRHTMTPGKFRVIYEWRGGRIAMAVGLLILWGALLTVWLGLYG